MTPGAGDERAPRATSRSRPKADPESGETGAPGSVGNAAAARRKPSQSPVKKPVGSRARTAAAAAARSVVADEASAATDDAPDVPTAEPTTARPAARRAPARAPRATPSAGADVEAPPATTPKPRAPRSRKPAASTSGPSGSRSASTTAGAASSARARATPAAAARAASPAPTPAADRRAPVRGSQAGTGGVAAAAAVQQAAEPVEVYDGLEAVQAYDGLEAVQAYDGLEAVEPHIDEPAQLPDLKLVPALDVQTTPVRKPARPVRTVRPKSRPVAPPQSAQVAVELIGLTKRYGAKAAVDSIDLSVRSGSFYGIVGPNGAGKTTTLSMLTGLVRPDAGRILVDGIDVWAEPKRAKQAMGVLPDRLRLFDRLTGSQLLEYSGSLRGLDRATRRRRAHDLATAFELTASLDRFVADYSAGMTKKIALAAAMIHSPRVLVLDEPFESVDPVSSAVVVGILQRFTAAGGTVIMSSHSMELIERVCDSVAVIVDGGVLASGPLVDVLQGRSLEDRFVELAGGTRAVEGMEWLQSFSD